MSLEEKAGQLLIVGYRSEKQIREIKPGGVTLFSWSMKSVEDTRNITKSLKEMYPSIVGLPLLIAVDHEGGRVVRLRRGMTVFPDAAAVGAINDPYLAFKLGKAMGHELVALGFNTNFAPVMDLGNAKSFLENRVWGDDPVRVAELTSAFIQGLHTARVLAVAKHFPGHGGTNLDSHYELPTILKDLKTLWQQDLYPFRIAINRGVDAMMTAHVSMPEIERVPASLSKRFITDVLRQQLKFDGLVITDDLEMGGVKAHAFVTTEDLALEALKAGSDMILVVWSIEKQRKIKDRIVKAVKSGELSEEWIDEKINRISNIKNKYIIRVLSNPHVENLLRKREFLELSEQISKKSISWETQNRAEVEKKFYEKWNDSWFVLTPSGAAEKFWKSVRASDDVLTVERRADTNKIKKIKMKFETALDEKRIIVVITPPRARGSEDIFHFVRKSLAKKSVQNEEHTVLWLHQGSRPIKLLRPDAAGKIALVSLHNSSVQSLRAVLDAISRNY